MAVEWTSSSDEVVLEVVPDGKKASEDTDKASWSSIIKEIEDAGVVEYCVNSHEVSHAGGDAAPKKQPCNLETLDEACHASQLQVVARLPSWEPRCRGSARV